MSISFAPELGEAVREAAERAGMTLSEWLAEAAKAELRAEVGEEGESSRCAQDLTEYLTEWQGEHGAFTEEELAQAARDLGLDE